MRDRIQESRKASEVPASSQSAAVPGRSTRAEPSTGPGLLEDAVRVAREGTAQERAALLALLRRFSRDLAPQRPHHEGTLAEIFAATPDSELELLRATLAARFGLDSVDDPSAMVAMGFQADSFNATELRRMWRTLEALPQGHTESTPGFRRLTADSMPGSSLGGHYVGRRLIDQTLQGRLSRDDRRQVDAGHGTVGMTANLSEMNEFHTVAVPRARAELRRRRGLMDQTEIDAMEAELADFAAQGDGDRHFDATLRHEIGHAVDEQLAASSTYCHTPAGGGWRMLGVERDALFDDVFAALGIASSSRPVLSAIRARVEAAVFGVTPRGRDDRAVMTPEHETIASNIIAMLSWAKNVPPSQLPRQDLGGWVYTLHPGGSWMRYDRSARDRQVSNYQFHAPAEWFAEAYSAYYDPAGARGARLVAAGDAATKRYFDTVVEPFVATQERDGRGQHSAQRP